MAEDWRGIIQDRYENNMHKVKPLLPMIAKKEVQQVQKEPELPKPVEISNIDAQISEVIEIKDQQIEIKEIPQIINASTKEEINDEHEDQAGDFKSDAELEEVDLSNVKFSVGSHKTNNLKLSWVENKSKNKDDFHSIEWGKESNASFVTGKIQFPVPMFWDSDGHKMHLDDNARGSSVILTGSTVNQYDKCHQITVNNNVNSMIKIFTSQFEKIDIKTLKSPVIKIMPLEYARKMRSDGIYNFHSPFTYYYMRNHKYQNDNFWYEDCFFNDQNIAYNDLITSLRILYVIGYRAIFLDGFTSSIDDFAIYDNVIKHSLGKLKIFNIGNDNIRGISKFDRSKAIASCIL